MFRWATWRTVAKDLGLLHSDFAMGPSLYIIRTSFTEYNEESQKLAHNYCITHGRLYVAAEGLDH